MEVAISDSVCSTSRKYTLILACVLIILINLFWICCKGYSDTFEGPDVFESPDPSEPIDTKVEETLCVHSINLFGPIYSFQLEKRTSRLLAQLKDKRFEGCQHILQEVWLESHINHLKDYWLQESNRFWRHSDEISNLRHGLGMMLTAPPQKQFLYTYEAHGKGLLDWVRDQFGVRKALIGIQQKVALGTIWQLNTHLHPTDPDTRKLQVLELLKILKARTNFEESLMVLSADLNAQPDSPILNTLLQNGFVDLTQSFRKTQSAVTCTYCEQNTYYLAGGSRWIDYILVRPPKGHKIQIHSVELTGFGKEKGEVSDHYGILARFAWQNVSNP